MKDQALVDTGDQRPGEYLGSGRGRASGEGLSETVRRGIRANTGRTSCDMFLNGVIDTDDGATITFETLGRTVPLRHCPVVTLL